MDVETIFENLLQDMTAVRDTVGDGCEMVIAMSAKVAGKLDLAKGGILKSYPPRVGEGPFPTELNDATGELLRTSGGEFGVTTGRPRRCGWQDIPVLRESARLNGLTDVALTKLDVLSGFDTIQICVAYEYKGKRMDYPPQEQGALDLVSPVYESMPGWKEDITACKTWDELPEAARAYVQRLEQLSGVPVSMVSVGPDRNQTIFR